MGRLHSCSLSLLTVVGEDPCKADVSMFVVFCCNVITIKIGVNKSSVITHARDGFNEVIRYLLSVLMQGLCFLLGFTLLEGRHLNLWCEKMHPID